VLHDGLDPVAANARRHGGEGELSFLRLRGEEDQLIAADCTHQHLLTPPTPTLHPAPITQHAHGENQRFSAIRLVFLQLRP